MIVIPGHSLKKGERRTRVKFCGLTRPQDAEIAAEVGVDALGVVFAESPRQMGIPSAMKLLIPVPGTILRVGVFADQSEDIIREAIERCELDWIQLSGSELPELAAALPVPVIKAVHVNSASDAVALADYPAGAFLLDAPATEGLKGGRGVTFDWSNAQSLPWPRRQVIVAGGLNAGNVGEAILHLRPGGVDVSSGIEVKPGIKDRKKMENFMEAVKWADARLPVEEGTDISTAGVTGADHE